MTAAFNVLLALACLMAMVVVHEFGHYIAGKILGFKICEFSIGFGPKLFSLRNKRSSEIFSVRLLPLGGFCRFAGEDESDVESDPDAFDNHPPWKRLIVLFSGALFNFMSAIVIIAFAFAFHGQLLPVVDEVVEESYVAREGILRKGDAICAIDGKAVMILDDSDIRAVFEKLGADGAEVELIRDGKAVKAKLTKSEVFKRDEAGNIARDESGAPQTELKIGCSVGARYVRLDFFKALGRSFGYCFFIAYKVLWSLGRLLSGKIRFAGNAGGPISVIRIMSEAVSGGWGIAAHIVCIVSANLAVMNLLPLPALDGSRMAFVAIEWIRGKPIDRKAEGIIHFAGLMALLVIAVAADILQFVK